MEASADRTRWTWAEFARLPSGTATRHEVIDGELFVTPAPSVHHQRIVTDLVTLLNAFVQSNDLGELLSGPVDVIFAEGDYLEPDIVFVRRDRTGLFTDRGLEGPPDLVVEVTSPSTAVRDRGIKLDRYSHFGVPEYWVVDPAGRSIERWQIASDAAERVVYDPGDTLSWAPVDGGPVLEIDVGAVIGDSVGPPRR